MRRRRAGGMRFTDGNRYPMLATRMRAP
jgi:hypothetical protein